MKNHQRQQSSIGNDGSNQRSVANNINGKSSAV